MIIKSKDALAYVSGALEQITGDKRQKWGSLKQPLRLDVVVYYPSYRHDLSIELLKDILEEAEVIGNDRYIREEHCYALIDRQNPRVMLRLIALPGEPEPPFK